MDDKYLKNWERQRKIEIDEFFDGWDWQQIFRTWKNKICDYPISLEALFKEITIYDPKNPYERENILTWQPIKTISEFQLEVQRHFDNWPGTVGPINQYNARQGELRTLDYLWEYQSDIEKVAAILINASLFTRLHSSRGKYPMENWPSCWCVQKLYEMSLAIWNSENKHFMWQHYNTEVLPYLKWDYDYQLNNLHALISYLAEEHALLLLKYYPVVVVFKEKRDPFIEKRLNDERIMQQQKWDEISKLQSECQDKKVKGTNSRWENMSRNELEKLVWTKPTVALAKELGVSDVAIGKRCKSMNITKPKPGFWAKVNAGLIPNPKGKPVVSD
ncbi:MAG: hypothetical protein AB9883_00880 [Acidaminococcaceae bacterium]